MVTFPTEIKYSICMIIKIMAEAYEAKSCTKLLKKFHTLPIASKYLLHLMTFISENTEMFQINSEVHIANVRQKHDLHRPTLQS